MNINVEVPAVRRSLKGADGDISFLDWKSDNPSLVPVHFAHANGFNGLTYRALLAPLAHDFHVRAWDARGHGFTTLPADPANHLNWMIFADDLIRFIEAFAEETNQKIILGGHSMGGATSIFAAARRPDLVRGLWLVDPVIVPHMFRWLQTASNLFGIKFRNNPLAEGAERRRNSFPSRADVIKSYTGKGAFRTWAPEFLADYVEGGMRELADGTVELACAPQWEAANFRAQGHNIWRAIARLKVPVSLLYADIGSTCRDEGAAALRRRDPQAHIERVVGASHFLPMEQPERLRAALRDLVERTGA